MEHINIICEVGANCTCRPEETGCLHSLDNTSYLKFDNVDGYSLTMAPDLNLDCSSNLLSPLRQKIFSIYPCDIPLGEYLANSRSRPTLIKTYHIR